MKKLAMSVISLILVFNQAALASDFRFSPRQHKAQLIRWKEWGKKSLDEAKKEDKLILLSLSAVWCHWCHVMDETTYSDSTVIDYINTYFIPIRVDANMRPDIDDSYNQGGWPSTVILTPEGEVVQGGTYISSENMLQWLSGSVAMFAKGKKGMKERIETMRKRKEAGQSAELTVPGDRDIARITAMITSSYDKKYGGFGISQKFPNPGAIDFLLSEYLVRGDPELKTIIRTTLKDMSEGEIYDRIEGGFFRYSANPDWSAPHYEKMLDLNAELIRNYASAYLVFGNSSYRKVLNQTIAYVEKYLSDKKTGAFYGSQDADEEYYKKTERKGLAPPFVDETIYADSNAQMITGLLAVYSATGERVYREIAEKTAAFLMKNLYSKQDGVFHYYLRGDSQLSGLLSDNVLVGLSLIDLYNATGQRIYIDTAEDIGRFLTHRLYNNETRQFASSPGTTVVRPSIPGPLSEYNTTSANYRAMIFLSRLYYMNEDKHLKKFIDDVNTTLRNSYEKFAPSAAFYGTALKWNMEEPVVITIIADDSKAGEFLSEMNKVYIPQKVVKILSLRRDRDRVKELRFPLEEASYLCWGKKCSVPITRPEDLTREIKRFLEILRQKAAGHR